MQPNRVISTYPGVVRSATRYLLGATVVGDHSSGGSFISSFGLLCFIPQHSPTGISRDILEVNKLCFGAMAHRPKATTYGKASHRPIVVTGDAFAKASEADAQSSERNTLGWKRDFRPMVVNTADTQYSYTRVGTSRRSTTPHTVHILAEDKPVQVGAQQRFLTSSTSHTAEKKNHLDERLSDDDGQKRNSISHTGSRKRRRISLEAATEGCSIVYDDASLQRHIAAESRSYKSPSPSLSGDTRIGNRLTAQDTKDKRRNSLRVERHGSFKARMNSKQELLEDEANSSAKSSCAVKARPHSRNHAPQPMMPSQKKTKASRIMSHRASQISEPKKIMSSAFAGSVGGYNKGWPTYERECLPPKTPAKPVKFTKGSTTPRQRELWTKLLIDAPPNALDLPGLRLTDKPGKRAKEQEEGPKHPVNTNDGNFQLTHKRIVDTLHPWDQCVVDQDNAVSEDSRSSTTEISESMETERSAMNDAVTVQTPRNAENQRKSKLSGGCNLSSVPQPTPIFHPAAPKITYTRQRSYLTDVNHLDEVTKLSIPGMTEPFSGKESERRAIGERQPVSQSQVLHSTGDQRWRNHDWQSGAIRSIHELREAGGNVRLVSELEAILDDIEEEQPPSSNLRRARLLDLTTKLQEPSSSRLFIDHGMESRLLAHLGVDTDTITNSLLATALLQLMAGPTSTTLLSQVNNARIVGFLIDLLGLDQCPISHLNLRDYDLPEYFQHKLDNISCSMSKSAIWRGGSPPVLSCHVLALQCLEYLVRQTRDTGSMSDMLSAYAIRRIVATSVPFSPTPKTPCTIISPVNLELAVSILESCTICSASEGQESLWEGETLERVTGLLPLLNSLKGDEYGPSRTLTLRLYVNLTNNNPGLCETFSTSEVVEVLCKMIVAHFEQLSSQAIRRQKPKLLDDLILSLGALVNLAESSEMVRLLVMETRRRDRSYLDLLLELFMNKSKGAAEVRLLSLRVTGSANSTIGLFRGRN